jgi:dihydroflavonol-4-reductase
MIFITGCNGLVGSFVARKLLSEGHAILALRRKNSDCSLLYDIQDQIEWIEGDVLDIGILNEAIKRCDTVIHTAAVISFSPKKRKEMYKINVEGTANIVNAALAGQVRHFCYISSIAALGRKKDTPVVSETALWEDSDRNTHYAKSKYLAELEVWRGIEEGLPAFIVNPSVILGPGNWERGSTKLFKYIYNENKFYTNGNINYVDVYDVAEIIVRLLGKNVAGERFILNAGTMTYKELFERIAKAFGKKAPTIEVGTLLAEVAWRIEHLRTLFHSNEPIITKETARMSGYSYTYENAKIKQLLGYEFAPVKESIDRICQELTTRSVNN